MSRPSISLAHSLRMTAFSTALALLSGYAASAGAAVPGTVEISPTPPDLTTSVDPNVLVTFDDSGSMAWTHMGDGRPYDGNSSNNSSWNGPWRCANVIDPRVTDPKNARSRGMNGVYYNPNITYTPPVNSDGSSFPQADATLRAVWQDGIAVNRPVSPIVPNAASYGDNPDGNASVSNNKGVTDLTGTKTRNADNRWQCGTAGTSDGKWSAARSTQNPFDGATADPDTGATPNGGPVYWRFKASAASLLTTDPTTGRFTTSALTALYTAANWEAVSVPVSQYQNFANWYAYYRYRNLMARTAMSRVFGALGSNIRVAWQNLNNSTYQLPASTIIASLTDVATDPTTSKPFRQAFFNWIFQVGASGSTPSRSAAIRAGEFFKRGNTADLRDPYWEAAQPNGMPAQELACRQNFHMLMTDGLYNQPAVSVSGNGSTTSTGQSLPGTPLNTTGITSYTVGNGISPTTIFKGFNKDSDGGSTYSDISFYYWANNLRPDFATSGNKAKVAPYYPDLTVGVTGPATATVDTANPGATPEVFWNPVNDPATWPHLVQFAVTLGAFGTLDYSTDIDCKLDDGYGVGNNDLCKLRKGTISWPQPNGSGSGIAANIDDLWHGAINSRGAFFVATNPQELVTHLTDIINSILVRSTSSTQPTLSMAIATSNGASFSAGYDSAGWSGNVTRLTPFDTNGNPLNPPIKVWEAGCILTGGNCLGGARPARDPSDRVILTSSGSAGIAFRWGNLSTAQQAALNLNPASIAVSPNPANWTSDGFGSKRVDYVRGDRTYEASGTPQFHRRQSVLGAVINSQPVYVSSPDSGWSDNFPAGSPEATAAASGNSYAKFVNDNKSRAATVYVGANDGMLHAFNAVDGSERWAYVPAALYTYTSTDPSPYISSNVNLVRYTDKSSLVPTVNNKPTQLDVFINGSWRTVLVGSLGLGGRGIFALDITHPDTVTEARASQVVMWEFTNKSTGGANLGYTFGRPQIVRLSSGKWAVLLTSGYFPSNPTVESYDDPASNDTVASKTSLFVIDLATGALIREIQTSTAPQFSSATATYGLTTAGVYDVGGDQVDDIATAGDLAGNLWRFDLRDPTPANWKVDLLFKTYTTASDVGKYPISVMPVGMRVPATRGIVWIFGTGKYIGKSDRTTNIPAQAIYGVYDGGTNPAGSVYPILPSSLLAQTMTEDTQTPPNRYVTLSTPTATNLGWKIPLNITAEPGERNTVNAFALDTSNRAILTTLIPTSNDPCNPGRRGAEIVVDAASGGGSGIGDGNGSSGPLPRSGVVDTSGAIPITGDLSPFVPVGGGGIGIPGIPGSQLNIPDNYWFRSAWRELLDIL